MFVVSAGRFQPSPVRLHRDDVHGRKNRITGSRSCLSWFDDVHGRKHRTTGSRSYLLWFGDTMHSRKHRTTSFLSYLSSWFDDVHIRKHRLSVLSWFDDVHIRKHRTTGPWSYLLSWFDDVHRRRQGPQALGLTYCGLAILCIAENTGPQAFCLTCYRGLTMCTEEGRDHRLLVLSLIHI